MHQSPIATWQGIETDAYALLVREEGDTKNLYGIQSSFLRRDGAVIQGSSRKSIITRVAL
jgi:hypothetical protein